MDEVIPCRAPSSVADARVDTLPQGLAFADQSFGLGIVGLVLKRDAIHGHRHITQRDAVSSVIMAMGAC